MIKAIPTGISEFPEMRSKKNGVDEYYYVDKTRMIKDMLDSKPAKVTLITRPRRFGKSLNMSMLECFLDINRKDDHLFDGLKIMKEQQICDCYMHKYPIIHISFKDIMGTDQDPDPKNLDEALCLLSRNITKLAQRFLVLKDSSKLNEYDKSQYLQLIELGDSIGNQPETKQLVTLLLSLQTLAELVHKHYGVAPVLLIDEYDVPLNAAFEKGYYRGFVDKYKVLLSSVLKDNSNISFAVITGCLKISKESIFTGLNNLRVIDVTMNGMARHFGFSDDEVQDMLEYYGLGSYHKDVKKFYDGYYFGAEKVYNPWAVLEFISNAKDSLSGNMPLKYACGWIKTSGNAILNNLLEMAQGDAGIAEDVDTLENGGTIRKRIVDQLTFDDMYDNIASIWTVMLHSGYLTCERELQNGYMELRVPNQEVLTSFDELVKKLAIHQAGHGKYQKGFCEALESFDPARIEEEINRILENSVSIRDTQTKDYKENFYHGILLSALLYREDWERQSNPETGDGYCDILVQNEAESWGVILELKYSRAKKSFEAALNKGKQQIVKCKYNEALKRKNYDNTHLYAIAFRKRKCQVTEVFV